MSKETKQQQNLEKKNISEEVEDSVYAETVCSPEFGCMDPGLEEKEDADRPLLFTETVCSPEFGCLDQEIDLDEKAKEKN